MGTFVFLLGVVVVCAIVGLHMGAKSKKQASKIEYYILEGAQYAAIVDGCMIICHNDNGTANIQFVADNAEVNRIIANARRVGTVSNKVRFEATMGKAPRSYKDVYWKVLAANSAIKVN